ncbi:MAG: PAS domain S-box protein [Candidatus Zixiibacteriota bacterium]|nr:MAG: PAS domain S-box protein [candidate division Zixibacteria bacterium]
MKNARGLRLKIISLSVLFAFLVYILDVVFEYYVFYKEGFWNLLILNVPPHELFMRLVIIALFILLGTLISGLFSSRLNALRSLSATEAKLAAILRSTGDAVIATDANGHISFMNRVAEKVTGWEERETLGRSVDDVFYIVDAATGKKADNPVRKVIKECKAIGLDNNTILIRKDGTRILIGDSAAPVLDDSGKINGAVLVFRDESERKGAEFEIKKSEEKFRSLVHTARNVILYISPDHEILEFNPEAERVYGLKRNEVLGKNYLELCIPANERENVAKNFEKVLSGEPTIGFENRILTHDGQERIFLWNVNIIPDNTEDNPLGVIAIGYDITDRKKVENSIRESEQKFRNIAESSPMGMHFYRLEPDGKLTFEGANPAADKLLDLNNNQFVGKTIEEAFPGSIGTEIPEKYRAAASDGRTWQTEQVNYVDEKIKGAFQVVAFQTTKNRMAAMFFDITEQKIIEKELKESEERFRSTFEQAAVGIAHVAPDGKFIRINQRFCAIVGYSKDELIRRTFQDITHPDDVQRDIGILHRMLSGDLKIHSIEKRYCRKDGAVVWVNLTTRLLRDQNNKPKYFISVIEDISDRKKAEDDLKKSEEKFRSLFEAASDSIFIVEMSSEGAKFVDCNSSTLEIFRCNSRKDVLGKCPADFSPEVQADGRSSIERVREIAAAAMKGQPQSFDWIHCRLDKTPFDAEVTVNRIDIAGKPFMQVIVRDVTERKRAEEALRESEEKFRNVAEQSPNMIFINRRGRIVYVNNRSAEILGYSKDEFYSPDFDFLKLIAPEYAQMVKEKYERHLRGEDVEPYEYALLTKDGRKIEGIINTKIIQYEGENSLLGIVTDITDRKRAEEAIKESEEKFRNVAEQSPNMIFINKQGRIVFVNNKCEEIMGYTREEFCSPDFDFLSLIAPEYIQNIKANFDRHMKGEDVEPYEYALITKERRRIDSIINTKLIKYEGEISILGIVTDITERKKTEKAMEKSRQDLVKAQHIAKIGSWEWVMGTDNIYFSDEMYLIYGIDNGAKITVDLLRKTVYPEDLNIFDNAVKNVFDKIPPKSVEYRIIKPGGDIAYVHSTAEILPDDRGDPVRIIGTLQDITERKRAEELREKLIADLQNAANEIKTLSGFIPICASCKKIRDDKGYWEQIETYIMEHSDAEFSHGLCPDCSKKLYPDL